MRLRVFIAIASGVVSPALTAATAAHRPERPRKEVKYELYKDQMIDEMNSIDAT